MTGAIPRPGEGSSFFLPPSVFSCFFALTGLKRSALSSLSGLFIASTAAAISMSKRRTWSISICLFVPRRRVAVTLPPRVVRPLRPPRALTPPPLLGPLGPKSESPSSDGASDSEDSDEDISSSSSVVCSAKRRLGVPVIFLNYYLTQLCSNLYSIIFEALYYVLNSLKGPGLQISRAQ